MAKRTLLDLTQGILSEMDGDSVNSISDTIEATSVAEVIREVYFELVDEMDLKHTKTVMALTGLGDTSKPNIMKIPDEVSLVDWIKYDTRVEVAGNKSYADIDYLTPADFIRSVNGRPSTDTTNYQVVMWDSNVPLVISKTSAPRWWTSFDDEYIVFDGYDSDVDSTLQSSKSIVSAFVRPTFSLTDGFIPDLPENLFTLLYTTSLGRVFANQKQTINPKVERAENRMRVRSQRNKWREGRILNDSPNYGRK